MVKPLIATVIILVLLNFLFKKKTLTIKVFEKQDYKNLILFSSILFLVFCYLIPTSYYYPINNGVLGDNYLHMYWGLSTPGFIKPHHPLFPLIPEKFIRLLLGIKLLSTDDPMFLEDAYYWSIFPVSLGVMVSLFLFSNELLKKEISRTLWISIFLLFSTSFGIWIWSMQSNAIGLAIAMEFFTATAFIYWYKKRSIL